MNFPDAPEGKSGWPWEAPKTAFAGASSLPRISIVTPSYNQGQFLEETIRSVLLQGYPNLEYWVMDGGSSDNSVEIIRKYEPWLAGWVSEKDAGQSDAINKGWRRSTGEYMTYLNSDDLLAPGCLFKMMAYFAEHPEVDLLYGDLIIFDEAPERGKRQGFALYRAEDLLTTPKWIPQQGTLFRRKVYETLGDLDRSLHFSMDYDYFLKTLALFKAAYLPEVVAYFRYHPDSKTTSRLYMSGDDVFHVHENFFSSPVFSAGLGHLKKKAAANAWYVSAVAYYMSDRPWQAFVRLCKAFLVEPRRILRGDFHKTMIKILLSACTGGRQSRVFRYLMSKIGSSKMAD